MSQALQPLKNYYVFDLRFGKRMLRCHSGSVTAAIWGRGGAFNYDDLPGVDGSTPDAVTLSFTDPGLSMGITLPD